MNNKTTIGIFYNSKDGYYCYFNSKERVISLFNFKYTGQTFTNKYGIFARLKPINL